MTDPRVSNAIIIGTSLSTADHGYLSSFISLDYGNNSGQSFGGFALYAPNSRSRSAAGIWIWRVLEIAGVDEWSKLKGRCVRARHSLEGVDAIGHITEDDWFDPRAEFAGLEGRS